MVVGTSGQFLGKRRPSGELAKKPVILVLGAQGVGKTSVAKRLAGEHAKLIRTQALNEAAVVAVRKRKWPEELMQVQNLILDGPTFLSRRPGVSRLLVSLIHERSESGLRTFVCQRDDDDSILLLCDELSEDCRVLLNLRFPTGGGQTRFAGKVCDELGIHRKYAREIVISEPWTYLKVIRALHKVKRGLEAG
jgi:adenylate kinase family enzyme